MVDKYAFPFNCKTLGRVSDYEGADLKFQDINEGKSKSNQPIPFPIDRDIQDFHALFQYMF